MSYQLGMGFGWVASYTSMYEQFQADLIIRKTSDPSLPRYMPPLVEIQYRHLAWLHPAVSNVDSFNSKHAQIITESNSYHRADVYIMDTSAHSLSYPKRFSEQLKNILSTPGMAALTRLHSKNIGLKLGDKFTLNNDEMTLAAIIEDNNIANAERVYISQQTARLLGMLSAWNPYADFFLVKLHKGAQKAQVINELNTLIKPYKLEAKDISNVASEFGILQLLQGTGIFILGSAVFGLIIGCGITSQTLRAALLSYTREFASLRALGVQRRHLAAIAMEQSFWVGLISIPFTLILAHFTRYIARFFDISIALPVELLLSLSALLLILSLLAGLISLSALTRAEPAVMLR